MPRALIRDDLLSGRVVYCLTLDFAGRRYYWASIALTVSSDDGDLTFAPADDLFSTAEHWDFLTSSPGDMDVSLVLDFPPEVDVPRLVAQGQALERATGELSVLVESDTWEQRYVILRGRVVDPVYGDPGEGLNVVALTLSEQLYEDTAVFPPTDWTVTLDTYTTAPDEALGYVYPFVFGFPGDYVKDVRVHDEDNVLKATPCVPINQAGTDHYLMVAGHPVMMDGQTVQIYDATDNEVASFTIADGVRSDTGQHVSYVDIYGGFTGATGYEADHDYWVTTWDKDIAIGSRGGYPNQEWSDALHLGGDVLAFMLSQTSLEVDKGRTEVARQQLQGYSVSGYIDERVSPYAWIQDQLLPVLPVAIMSGPDGVYPLVWRYDATAAMAVELLSSGPDVERVTGVLVDSSQIVNEASLRYVPINGAYARQLTISGQLEDLKRATDGTVEDIYRLPNLFARASYRRYGKVFAEELSSSLIWDESTAAAVLSWRIRSRALAQRTVTYECDLRYAWIEPGAVVLLTDADLHWTEQICLVRSRQWGGASVRLELLILEDLPLQPRAT